MFYYQVSHVHRFNCLWGRPLAVALIHQTPTLPPRLPASRLCNSRHYLLEEPLHLLRP